VDPNGSRVGLQEKLLLLKAFVRAPASFAGLGSGPGLRAQRAQDSRLNVKLRNTAARPQADLHHIHDGGARTAVVDERERVEAVVDGMTAHRSGRATQGDGNASHALCYTSGFGQ
jgi:hypothetical protein